MIENSIADEDQTYVPTKVYEYRIGQCMLQSTQNIDESKSVDKEGVEEMRLLMICIPKWRLLLCLLYYIFFIFKLSYL